MPAGLGWNSRRRMQQRPEAPKCRLTTMRRTSQRGRKLYPTKAHEDYDADKPARDFVANGGKRRG